MTVVATHLQRSRLNLVLNNVAQASTRAERDTDEASRHKELVRLKNDMDGAKHVIITKAMELEVLTTSSRLLCALLSDYSSACRLS